MSLNGNLNKSQFMEELQQKVEHINNVLEKFLPVEEGQQRIIFEAMNYSVRAGGKRLRLSSWKRLTICLAEAVQ